jgi:hypothetical protein
VSDPADPTHADSAPESGGFGGFLRSLLAGIPWSERAEDVETLCFRAPSGDTVRLHNSNGGTRVLGEDRRDVEVCAAKSARAESSEAAKRLLQRIRIVGHEIGEALELDVELPKRWNRRGHANLELHVPRETSLEISNPNGKVCISGVRGRVQVRASNGSARVADVVGDIDINTSNAKVCCSCNAGRLFARSSNGKIELDRHRGSVDVSTSNGSIRASIEAVGRRGVQLATSNGRIVLDLPDPVDADFDIWIDNGIIRNDRKLETTTRDTKDRVLGRVGSGGPPIKLRTSNGSISVR